MKRKEKVVRYKRNPVIIPEGREKATFNPGIAKYKRKFYLLYRTVYEYKIYRSYINLAISKNGLDFDKIGDFILPKDNFDKFGCEDPRVTKIENTFVISYTALNKPVKKGVIPKVAIAITKDFKKVEKLGVISSNFSNDKDLVIFPKKFGKKYLILHRPSNWRRDLVFEKNGKIYFYLDESKGKFKKGAKEIFAKSFSIENLPRAPSIWIGESKDLKSIKNERVLITPSKGYSKAGAGAPPIKTKDGWLLIYHQANLYTNFRYDAFIALLDRKDPSKVLSKKFLFGPKESYELYGDIKNVVFPTGVVKVKDMLYIYYGSADKYCCVAFAYIDELLSYLEE